MNDETFPSAMRQAPHARAGTDPAISLGLTAVLAFFLLSGSISYLNVRTLQNDNQLIIHTHEVLSSLDDLVSSIKDAETGQRGFLLTNDEKYLGPYIGALAKVDENLTSLEQLTAVNPIQHARLAPLKVHIDAKKEELKETIDLRSTKGFDAALAVIATDRGKAEMDAIRTLVAVMDREEQNLRDTRVAEIQSAYRTAIVSGFISCALGIFLSIVAAGLMRRASAARRMQAWFQQGRASLAAAMLGDQRTDQLGDNVLKFMGEYFDAHAGVFFIKDGGEYRKVAAFGIPESGAMIDAFKPGEGLLGQAAKEARPVLMHDVPEGYVTIGSALGQDKPRHLVIAPALSDGDVNAVIELGFVHPLNENVLELLQQVSESIGVAVRSANYRADLQNFLEETQRQAEELQAQGEELRVSNEELEEQSRALKESQGRLEQQQAELEQTNAQLEEQAQQLEVQRDELTHANAAVQLKAQELEQASQYKSDFLANMSHELRTPLNSSLILAKLLADNPEENLTEEQVKYAQTIQSSGNDLLTLINDILDLSKIEAGHMEIRSEIIPLSHMTEDLSRMFAPMAKQKGLDLRVQILPECTPTIETDRQRLEQVLKNLLSNAIKFTEHGSIDLTVRPAPNGQVALSVTDTGIGISKDQQQAVFDAFRQADGTISRKYGGTGLGLSISRELVRLLGGTLQLRSEVGAGSTFTVTIPRLYNPDTVQPRQVEMPDANSKTAAPAPAPAPNPAQAMREWMEDDRNRLSGHKKILLVIEDDESFAAILRDLAHDLDFECLISHTAEDALIVARQYMPSAVVLDVGLPDHSGLSVLDRLKRDVRTRHIPVHVISASDYAETAFSLGAVGYMLKPVKREELTDVLRRLETKLSQRMRHVLVVEDDPVQREAVGKLLSSHDVEIVGAGTAAECLERLKTQTFDCMVLDLSLPDASGYALLETLSQEDAYSFPPVIVYTGRDLSADEESKLRRFSKSIIIKGAKSPERLLDEVSLFLHHVVSDLPAEQQKMIRMARNRDAALEGRRILVVEDDVRNVYSLTNILEPRGASVQIARNGREAIEMLEAAANDPGKAIDLVLMDVMMPVMDGLTATREIRKRADLKKLPVIMLTAKAMRDDQERCLEAGANDYMAKPLDVEKLLSLVRVWMPR